MALPNETVEEFQRIYEEVEGKKVNKKSAREMAENLVNAFRVIYKDIPIKNEVDNKNKRKN